MTLLNTTQKVISNEKKLNQAEFYLLLLESTVLSGLYISIYSPNQLQANETRPKWDKTE